MIRILLINPNISDSVSDLIRAEAQRSASPGTEVEVLTAPFGVAYIETRFEALIGAYAAAQLAAEHHARFDAVVVAAFGDPEPLPAPPLAPTPEHELLDLPLDAALPEPAQRFAGRSGPLRVLVVGGSLGARALNEALPQALALIDIAQRPRVTHQTGAANLEAVRAGYERAGVEAELRPFIDDMAQQLADCDLIVCRAGAVTVSELCAAGVAAVLVPLVVSTTSHQRDNAQWLAGQGAGIHLPQAELSPKRLAELLAGLTREALLAMATKARALAKPRAAACVADEIESLVAA